MFALFEGAFACAPHDFAPMTAAPTDMVWLATFALFLTMHLRISRSYYIALSITVLYTALSSSPLPFCHIHTIAMVVPLGEPSAVSPALLSAGWSFLFVLSETAPCLGTGCASALIMCPVSMLVCVVQRLGGDWLAHNQHYRLLVPNARFGGFTCQSFLVLLGMPGQGTKYLADGFGFGLSDTAPCLGSGSSSALIMCSALLDALLRC
jgi:hypothetical protein